jgi:branched-subunit amino acid ABC-type transport system permease component
VLLARLALVGLGVAMLAGCAARLDADQVALCRAVVPALHPEATRLDIRDASRPTLAEAGVPAAVRLDYTAVEPDEAPQDTFVICGFADEGFSRGRLDLVRVVTPEGEMGEARLFFLVTRWLSERGFTPVAAPVVDARHAPVVPFGVAYALQHLVNGLPAASTYALLAASFALIYGLAGRIVLMFGEVAVLGGYGALAAIVLALVGGWRDPFTSLALALAIGMVLSASWSGIVGRLLIRPLHERGRYGQPLLVATAAAALAMQEFLRLAQGAGEHRAQPMLSDPIAFATTGTFHATFTPLQLGVAVLAVALMAALLLMLKHSAFGRAWRAVADDPLAARLCGVDPGRVLVTTSLIAGGAAGFSGWVTAMQFGTISAAFGAVLCLKALVAAILGGIGSVPGAALGGLMLGLFEAVWSAYVGVASRDVAVFALLVAVFVLRPGGLLGFAGPRPRDV